MDESEINKLFFEIAGTTGKVPADVRAVFKVLVASTLRYRDHLKTNFGMVLTVEDVEITLDWLLESMQSNRLPKTNNFIRLDLFKIWIDHLKPYL